MTHCCYYKTRVTDWFFSLKKGEKQINEVRKKNSKRSAVSERSAFLQNAFGLFVTKNSRLPDWTSFTFRDSVSLLQSLDQAARVSDWMSCGVLSSAVRTAVSSGAEHRVVSLLGGERVSKWLRVISFSNSARGPADFRQFCLSAWQPVRHEAAVVVFFLQDSGIVNMRF